MNMRKQIKEYIATQPEPKRSDMQELHRIILEVMPKCKLWFLDGKDDEGRTVSNPNIGYGFQNIEYADGKTREFYQVGISANTTGISVCSTSITFPIATIRIPVPLKQIKRLSSCCFLEKPITLAERSAPSATKTSDCS